MIAVLAIYALLLQGVLTFAVSSLGDLGPNLGGSFPICHQATETAGIHPGAPNDHQHDHGSCALCCIVHCGMAFLAAIERPQALPLVHAAPRLVWEESDAPRRERIKAQPRGPPASRLIGA